MVVMATGSQRFAVRIVPVHGEVQYCILKDSGAGLLYCKRLKAGIEHQTVPFEDSHIFVELHFPYPFLISLSVS
jgi:hypothetical protein